MVKFFHVSNSCVIFAKRMSRLRICEMLCSRQIVKTESLEVGNNSRFIVLSLIVEHFIKRMVSQLEWRNFSIGGKLGSRIQFECPLI